MTGMRLTSVVEDAAGTDRTRPFLEGLPKGSSNAPHPSRVGQTDRDESDFLNTSIWHGC